VPAASDAPVLWQFRASHFNEKVRWALDWKGIVHERRSLLPGPHIPVVAWLTGQTAVPVLRLDREVIHDSTRIIAALEERFPAHPLYPADAAARARALELEEFFDEELGPHVRRGVFHAVLPDTTYAAELMTPDFPPSTKAIYRATFPLTRALMRTAMGISDDGAARSLARVDAAVTRLEAEIGAAGYLVGDAFTVADLTAAALLSPLAQPPEYPYRVPTPLPPAAQAVYERYRDRAAIAWARETYRRHRGRSAAIDV
jgi:glutathione S-transferase